MKTNYLLLLAVTLIYISCAKDEYTDSPEMRKAYIQTHDSTGTGDNDTTYIFRSNSKGVAENDSTAENSTLCDLFIEGKLIVDGGTSTDISDTFVTVEKITVNVWTDGKGMVTHYPVAHTDVAEPTEAEWENMPAGINYGRKRLNMEPLTISYKDYFYAEITVIYVLRVKDTKQAATDHYTVKAVCGSSNYKENKMTVLVPLELQTITFTATVDNYV